jgi:hypothetical protein
VGAINKSTTGTDETTSFILHFPAHNTTCIGLTTPRVGADVDHDFTGGPPIQTQGSDGEI